jgi:hypothetical protein
MPTSPTHVTLTAQQIESTLNLIIQSLNVTNGTLTTLNNSWVPQPEPTKPTIDGQLQTILGQLTQAQGVVGSILQKENVGAGGT